MAASKNGSTPLLHCKTLLAYITYLGLCLIILFSIGCTGKATVVGTAVPSQSDSVVPTLMIHRAAGEGEKHPLIVAVKNIAGIQEALPFALILPENLPLDLRLIRVTVNLPPANFDSLAKERSTGVTLAFRNENGTAAFQLDENLTAIGLGTPGLRTIRQDNTIVKVVEVRGSIIAVWEGCDIGFLLNGGPPDQLTEANLLRIVESTLRCQGPG